jgi:hypothetical protein
MSLRALTDGSAYPTIQTHFVGALSLSTNQIVSVLVTVLADAVPSHRMEAVLALICTGAILAAVILTVGLLAPDCGVLVLAGAPLAAPTMLYFGSFNLVLAYAPGFAATALSLRYLAGVGSQKMLLAIAGLELLCFWLHVQAAVVLAASIGAMTALSGLHDLRKGGIQGARRGRAVALAAATGPMLLAVAWYQIAWGGLINDTLAPWSGREKLEQLLLRREVVQFHLTATVMLALLGLATYALVGARLLRSRVTRATTSDLALAAAAGAGTLAMALPNGIGGAFQIEARLLPMAQFALFVWLLTAPLSRGVTRVLGVAALLAAFTLGGTRIAGHLALQTALAEQIAAEAQVEDGAAFLSLNLPAFCYQGSGPLARPLGLELGFDPLLHLGRGIGTRDVANLSNYQALSDKPYFPLKHRGGLADVIGYRDLNLPWVLHDSGRWLSDLLNSYAAWRGRPLDYVLIWRDGINSDASPCGTERHIAHALAQLRETHAPVWRSAPNAYAELWYRKPAR